MSDSKAWGPKSPGHVSRQPHRFGELLHRLLFFAHQGLPRIEFLKRACEILMEFSDCDALELRISEDGAVQRCRAWKEVEGQVRWESASVPGPESTPAPIGNGPLPEPLLEAVLRGDLTAAAPFLTRGGSFWTGDAAIPILLRDKTGVSQSARTVLIGGEYQSIALIPFPVDDRIRGVLQLGSRRREFFNRSDVQYYEAVAETLGAALAHQRAQWALRERVKELTCLYGVARAAQDPMRPRDDLLRDVADLLPPGWQYPEETCARVLLDGRSFTSRGFEETPWRQAAEINVRGAIRGRVEVCYLKEHPAIDEGPFLKEERHLIDAVAETLGFTLAYGEAQWALRERIKELTCLQAIAALVQQPELTRTDLLLKMAALLPPAFQFPEQARARITLDGQVFATPDFRDGRPKLSADIAIQSVLRGVVEVVYIADFPDADEGPFLKEERNLINEVALQAGLILQHKEAEDEKARLHEQLRHADRLATIGQLAAGTAHELNEPIGNMLGFAQLAKNSPQLPPQVVQDLDKIINASLHAREIIKKLMIFARQMPTRKSSCNLNALVREGLYFLESRCESEGIRLVRELEDSLPEITADSAQLHQVLVNLVVNAIQAMPRGGTLTIQTRSGKDCVLLTVQDTGTGMSQEVMKQLFIPFFTTKGVGQGTGLGLSVVHGIVTSHGGKIRVESRPEHGSRFVVTLPIREESESKENA